MKFKFKNVWKSLAYAIGLLAALAVLGAIPYLQIFAFLWLPGALLAALIFPEGIHSEFGFTYIFFAAFLDIALYTVPIYLLLASLESKKEAREQTSGEGSTT
jgi:hypothetical protein